MRGPWLRAVLVAASLQAPAAFARELPIERVVREAPRETQPRAFVGDRAAVGHVPSVRNVMGLERTHRFGLPTAESAALAKTVRVAVLRVQFRQEVPDDPRSTGDGHIDLRDTLTFFAEEGHEFERAPHNADFFATVLRAMAQYYAVVSNGRLTVTYEIYPTDRDSAYTLDSSMCYYGLLPPNEGLAYFVNDAVIKADADPDLTFSDYDAYMFFHAGSDAQHDFSPVTPTPCDFYTGYIRLLDSALFVPVDGGTHFVSDGTILPETATQDNRGTGLNGVTAHEFGHQLGLVDIYNTRSFFTQVGDFSLMDNDAQQVGIQFGVPWSISTFFDLLPVFPDAWSRAYLGFVNPHVVTPDSMLLASQPFLVGVAEGTDTALQLLKIPITAKEYFLAEFRSPDQDWNTNTSRPGDQGVGIRFDSTFNAVLGPATCNPQTLDELDSCRVLGRDYDFQFFLPGDSGGLMVWHVDEEVAYGLVPELEGDEFLKNNYDANTLQWDRFRRFLEVEEADGLVDFGGNYYTYFGGQRELFRAGYNAEFGPNTNPSSRSHTGAPSHLRLYDISGVNPPNTPPDNLPIHFMKVSVAQERAVPGWPQPAGNSVAPQLAVLRGHGADTVLASSDRYVLGWNADGTALITQLPGDPALATLTRFDFTTDTLTLSGLGRADTTLVTSPSVGTDATNTRRFAAAVDVVGKVYIWRFADGNADGWADLHFTYDLGAPAPQPPLWFDSDGDGDDELFVASIAGDALFWEDSVATAVTLTSDSVRDWALVWPQNEIYMAADDGVERAFPLASPMQVALGRRFETIVAVDDDRDGTDALFARAGNRLFRVILSPSPRIDNDYESRQALHGPLTSGDHDGDGYPSVFVGSGEWLAGYQPNLSLERNFPLRGNDVYSAAPVCEGVTVNHVTCFGGADGEVQGYTPLGTFAENWPLFAGDTVVSVATLRSSNDSTVILARSTNAYIWATREGGAADAPGSWTQSRAEAGKSNRWNATGVSAPAPTGTSLASETVYAYPNPAARGPVRIRFFLAESATVELSIYDLAGNEVDRAMTSGVGGMDNEWTWDASRIAPGIYYCRVQASQGGQELVEFCKVAISP
jgi:M6 family metalloprotease-like protein